MSLERAFEVVSIASPGFAGARSNRGAVAE
jgi:hypothetical protein